MTNQTNKLFECYVEKPTHDEAVEIVERLIANGVEAYDVVEGMYIDGSGNEYSYDEYKRWGYHPNFGSYTGNNDDNWSNCSKSLSIQEFRDAFPCDKYDEVVEEWDGEGLPPAGCNCEYTVSKFKNRSWYVGKIIAYNGDMVWVSNNGLQRISNMEFRPLQPEKTDREKFIEAGLEIAKSHYWTSKELLEALYDADFKAPEEK